jgi:hypothetical protein
MTGQGAFVIVVAAYVIVLSSNKGNYARFAISL